ncbi:hypothetical protein [Belnapia moabensis]|uniref:hypothetical protein n=1 Tax=Belnapia moabensis TaxID=365533 RepID=UPI0005BE87CF|nr:hypothetical protein [Belnapia moabensis]
MRHAIFGLALAALPLVLSLPAAADNDEPDIGLPQPPRHECRPLYTTTPAPIGPASADPEQATEGLVLVGTVCTPAR